MKYTKKAYLRLTPPASPVQSGGAVRVGQPDITQLLKTMAIRQEEEKTPYTDQLVRLKDELQQIMMDPKMEPGLKLKLLNDRSSVFRNMLRQSREGRVVTATPPATAAVAGVVPTTTPKKTPKPPIPPKPSILKASTKQQQQIFPAPLSTKPAIPKWDPGVIDPVTPKKRRRMTIKEKNQMSRDLLKAKRNLLKEMRLGYKESRQDKTRRKSTPLAHRTRSKTKKQKGSGYLDNFPREFSPGIFPGWKNVRFARMIGI